MGVGIVSISYFLGGGGHCHKYYVLVTDVKVLNYCFTYLQKNHLATISGRGRKDAQIIFFIFISFYFFEGGVDELNLY